MCLSVGSLLCRVDEEEYMEQSNHSKALGVGFLFIYLF